MAKHSGMRRSARRQLAALGCIALAAAPLLALSVPTANAAGGTVTVADSAESWYTIAPADVCTSPVGCPPSTVPSSAYPADTLHVGVTAGTETARTYVVPDLSTLPFGSTATSGTMTLPVDADNQSGTVSPDTAHLAGCLAAAPAPDGTQGTATAPPKVDTTVCSAAKYNGSSGTFTLDLSPFFDAWASGHPQDGIALMPDPKATMSTDAWHVAFNGRKRASVPHIASSVAYAAAPPTDTSGFGTTTPATTAVVPPPVTSVPNSGPLPAVTTGTPSAQAPQVAAAPATQPAVQPVALSRGFQYPAVFLMPIVLLAAALFFVRLFTRDALPLDTRPLDTRPLNTGL
jgi:hypothetical protein